jgi:nucleoside-diphosphate-sugar epimerase
MGAPRDKPFTADDTPSPRGPYERSKLEAEFELTTIAKSTMLELTVVRPPLVYGPNAPGNFGRLLRLTAMPVALPLGAIRNKRSIVSIYNLVDLLAVCCEHPRAAGRTFLVCDGVDISTTDLLRLLASRKRWSAWLAPVPESIVRASFTVLGRTDLSEKLLDSLTIDQTQTCCTLDWQPPYSLEQSINMLNQVETAPGAQSSRPTAPA